MAGTFNTTYSIELVLKLPELNHTVDININYHLIDKLLNYGTKQTRYFVRYTIISQEVSISMKLPDCTTYDCDK